MSSGIESAPQADPLDYMVDLWSRLCSPEQDSQRPPEEWVSQKAKREVEKVSDPLFVPTARTFLEQKLKGKVEFDQLLRLNRLLVCLLKSPVAEEAKVLLVELFKRPKMTMQLRIELTEAATEAKVEGLTEYVLPLFNSRLKGHKAAQYLTACPDPSAVDALGQFFLDNPNTIWGGGGFTLHAMEANISPRLLKYVVPVLEKEREGKSDADIDPRIIALTIVGKVADKYLTPLVMKELQNYSDRATVRCCLFALANLGDEQAYDLFIQSLSQYVKKYFEAAKSPSSLDENFFTFAWPYFQKVGRDKAPGVVALLQRLATPQVWQRMGDSDRRFFQELYNGLVDLPK